ncbi:OpgC domain-containing protein [Rhizobium calliandrae]|uniref:OpgC domain-containing protein n=1 Tax=Rhizobium calliandrae TaxID=1312182 RepID=A0ABT7KKE9_9HYPH|nr:OpgC domain-containing protein [Rhizobium calliandrae]MDL2409111.1 OpgC domain-containing protein [Rhizobium calliandrae]
MPAPIAAPSDAVPAIAPTGLKTKRPRDPRLDFFRGVGMLIILLAHIPSDGWALWIPARFGFSDATEMFVFQSGMASAIAFGSTYDRNGAIALTTRVTQRIWQIFWAHIVVFIVVAAIMVVAGTRYDGVTYVDSLNLVPFIKDPGRLLVGLLTLTYVPNYFDILPMYIVILALMPVMIFASKANRYLPLFLMTVLWLATQFGLTRLPAEPWSDRPWFFDPFGWQFLFFTGFFLMRGVLPAPGYDRRLMALAIAVVIATVPFAWVRFQEVHPFFQMAAARIAPLTDKTDFGLLRFVHFIALSYIVVHVVGEKGVRLRGPVVRVLTVVGQQSLAVFITGMVIAQPIGIALDHVGRTTSAEAVGNLFGFATLIGTAYLVRWFKSSPWKS